MKNSLRIHKWTHNEFNIFILGVLTHPLLPSLHCQSAKEALWAKLQTGRDVCGTSANQNFHAILYLLT